MGNIIPTKKKEGGLYQSIHSPGSDDDGLTKKKEKLKERKKSNNNNHAKKRKTETVLECVIRLLVFGLKEENAQE